ncbi:phage tail tape measure protein [Bacillus halotolerans]|uniref:phage tail tape measure protein n=1 Tax=Bacillus halotolerans TaxID=260554 RepID=UPI002DB605C1|nr:phage tail tape measure protein [Bacillus halotolerans]MEC1646606.1 phage tail tape measure protein [Bacillus halotolerans]
MATEGRPIGNLVINTTLNDAGVNRGITGLRNNLKTARTATKATVQEFKAMGDELTASKKQVEGLSNELSIQERIVEEYRKSYEKQVELYGEGSQQAQKYAQRLNTQIQSYHSLEGSLRRAQMQYQRLEQAQSQASESADELTDSQREIGDASGDAGGKVSKFSSFIKVGLVGALTAGIAGVTGLTAAVGAMGAKMALDTQKSQGEFRAQLGLTKDEAKDLTKAATSVWKDGFGENMDVVKNALKQVRQNIRGLSDKDLKDVTKGAITLSETFDADVNEVTRAGNNIMKGFGVESQKAFDLMTYGAQKGLNFSNEMFDNLSEYAPLFGKMGFSAEEYFQLLTKGSQAGVYNLDYINDVMKEFQIRVKDGSDSTSGAMAQLSGSTQKVWSQFLKGKGTVKDVSNAVLGELKGMKDQVKANNIGVALYGTKWEDLEADAMYALGGINGKIGDVNGKTKEAGKALQDNFGARLKKIGRSALSALLPIGNGLLDVLEPVMSGLESGMKSLEPTFNNIANAGKNLKTIFSGIMDVFNGDTSKGADKLMEFFPVLTVQTIIDGINNIKTAFSGFKQQAQPIISNMKASFDAMKPTFSALGTIASQVFGTLGPLVKQALGGVMSFIGQLTGQWKSFWQQNGSVITQALQNVWSIVQFVMPAILAIIRSVWGNIKGVITGAISIIQGVILVFSGLLTGNFSKMWEGIKKIFSGAIKVVWNAIQLSFFGKILGGAKALGAGLKGIFPKMWGWIKSLFKDGATNAGKMFSFLKDKAMKIVTDMKSSISKKFTEIIEGAKALPKKMGQGIKDMAGKALDGIKYLANKMTKKLGGVVNGVIGGVNWVLGKIGVDEKSQIPKWDVPQYAKGTSGHPGGPAILGDGYKHEPFMTPDGQIGISPNVPTLMNLPRGTQVMGGDDAEKMFGGSIPFYKDGTGGNWFTKMWGKAKDLALDVYDYVSNPSKLLNKVLEKIGVSAPKMSGGFGQIAVNGFKFIKDKAIKFIKDKIADYGSFEGAGGTAAVKKWVAQALNIKGLGSEYASALETIAMKESGGNPNVVNRWDSNWKAGHPSQGLMQFIPSTFNANKEPGYGNIKNPVHQILASINYLNSRYGGILNHPGLKSMARGGRYIGYDTGGLITRDHMAEVHKGEMLLPLRQFRRSQAHKVLSQAGKMVGYEPESRSSSSDENALKTMVTLLQQQNSNQQAEINLLSQTVRLLTQLVAKDPNVILSVQELNKIQDEAYNKERNQKGLLNNVSFS